MREKCPYLEFFWFVFSRIRTKYGEIRIMERYSVSLHIQSECGKIRTKKTLNTDTFDAVFRGLLNAINNSSFDQFFVSQVLS